LPTDDNLQFDLTEFLNLYPLRTPRIMWFLGAGTSVTAGLPTAATLTWEFKRALYCKSSSIPVSRFSDLNDRGFQTLVQSYFDSRSGNPRLWSDEEYSFYFQKFLPDERDRRTFLNERLRGTKPAQGHYCLAGLLSLGKTQIVWTTNFDTLVERAFQEVQTRTDGRGEMPVVNLANPVVLTDCIQYENWPVTVKLHGDYFHRKLKNLSFELQTQDQTLRRWLVEQCGRCGLAVVGYSGRDRSVMEALGAALSSPNPFPQGLFWFVRAGSKPAVAVVELLQEARNQGSQAGYVEIGGFDELMADLFLDHQDSLPQVRDLLKTQRERRKPFTWNYDAKRWPVIRTNALEITRYPSTCTVFEADIGGSKEVRDVSKQHWSRLTAARRRVGVIAFGNRADLLEVFNAYTPRNFDLFPIEPRRFRYDDSQEMGMFYDAICQGLAVLTGLTRLPGKKGRLLYAQTSDVFTDEQRTELAKLGITPVRAGTKNGPLFHEAIRISIEYRDERLWLMLRPTVIATMDGTTFYPGPDRSTLIREQLVKRYNRTANAILDFWIAFLVAKGGDPIRVLFPSGTNPDVEFDINTVSAFTRPT